MICRRTVIKGALASSVASSGYAALADDAMAQESDVDRWPQFQFNPANTGYSAGVTGPTTGLGARWTFDNPGGAVGSPVFANGTVYAGSTDGNLYAVNADDGTRAWQPFSANAEVRVPAVNGDENVVFVGDSSARLYAIDADSGDLLDQQDIGDGGGAVWALKNDVAYVTGGGQPAQGDAIVAVSVTYGNGGVDLSEKWRVQTGECYGGATSGAVGSDAVFITEDCGRTWAIETSSGDVRWRYDDGTGGGSGSPPTVANGTVYFGTNTVDGNTNTVHALDAATGEEKDGWPFNFSPSGSVTSSPAVADQTVFFGSENGNVYAVNAGDGTLAWDEPFSADSSVTGAPVVANGVLYVGANDGFVYLLDISTGTEIDRFETGDALNSAPAIASGDIYVGSGNGRLYAMTSQAPSTIAAQGSGNGLFGTGLGLGELLVGGGVTGVGLVGALLYRRRATTTDESRKETADDHSIDEFLQTADRAIKDAETARQKGNFEDAVMAYETAQEHYRTASESLPTGDDRQEQIQHSLATVSEALEEVRMLADIRSNLVELVTSAESDLLTAVTAHADDRRAVARPRYRQARDGYQVALDRLGDTDQAVLESYPLEITVDTSDISPPADITGVPDLTTGADQTLAEAGITSLEEYHKTDESTWDRVADLYRALANAWWEQAIVVTFSSEEMLESRRKFAVAGLSQL